jgi:HK97 gp10 family phage protein
MSTRVVVFGRTQTIQNLTNYNNRKQSALARIVEDSGQNVLQGAKARVSVDTGRLKSSLTAKTSYGGDNYQIEVGSDLFYALYVEYGTGIYSSKGGGRKTPWMYFKDGRWWWTKGSRPKPYLTPSFNNEENNFIKNVRSEMRRYS